MFWFLKKRKIDWKKKSTDPISNHDKTNPALAIPSSALTACATEATVKDVRKYMDKEKL